MRRMPIAGLMLLIAAAVAWPSDVRQIIAPMAEGITIDGALDDAIWQSAEMTEPFIYTGSHAEADIQTRVRVAFDRANLYIAVEADEPAMDAIRAPERERDHADIWQDDGVEIFLTPDLGGSRYYQLIHNVAGARYDALSGTDRLPQDWNPEPDWSVAVRRHADGWTSEIAIPFAGLGAGAPSKGDLWGLKIARSLWPRDPGGNGRFTSWSYCPGGYHDPAGWGHLYFSSTNLLGNGDFVAAATETGLPPGWRQALNWGQGGEDAGTVQQVELDGENVLLLHKREEASGSLLPRAYTSTRIRGGHRYRITAEMRGTGTAQIIFSWRTEAGSGYVPNPVKLGDTFETFSAECDVSKQAAALSAMFSFDRESSGDLWIRSVELTDLGVPAEMPEADLRHRLTTAADTLHEMKPYDLPFDDERRTWNERLIFTDTGTGTELRRIDWDWSAGDISYSNRYPWNPDGSAFLMSSWERHGPLYFIVDPTGEPVIPRPVEGTSVRPRWESDPDYLYYGTPESVMRLNWRTGEAEEIFRVPEEIKHGGRPRLNWNMEIRGVVYYEQAFGTDAPLYFIDLNTGEWTRIPITTDSTGDPEDDWLYSAGFSKLRGQWWVSYSLNHLPHLSDAHPYQQRLSSLDGTVGLNRMDLGRPEGAGPQPLYSHGGRSPDGRLETGYAGGGIALWDYEAWEGQMLVPGAAGGHISWMYQNDWFFAGVSGAPLAGPFSSQLLKVYTDGTWYRVAYGNTSNTEYVTNLFANTSPDGTKGAFMSTMLGPVNVYWCVIAYPEPPANLRAETEGATVRLAWDRPERSAELFGYDVYRSERSGIGYARVNDEPVAGESFTDTLPDPARAYYYVVTSVERSGLVSHHHTGEAVAGAADDDAPERLFVEAEAGTLVAPLRENLRGSASNLLFVDYRDGEGEGGATWRFPTRKAGPHMLWARMRYMGAGAPGDGWQVRVNGQSAGAISTGSREWEWVRVETPVVATAGGTEVTVAAGGAGFAIDKLLLTDDAEFMPQGEQKIVEQAPDTPQGLALAQARHFDLSIGWEAVPGAQYYQVYRGSTADFEPSQEHLVGSPGRPGLVEWGLQSGTDYWYRVTAVDCFGNESEPTTALMARTLALPTVVEVALDAEDGTVAGQAEMIEEPDASGDRYLKMEATGEGDVQQFPTLTLDFEVPVAGEYVAWLNVAPVSNRGYAYLKVAVDDGRKSDMLCRFPTRAPESGFADTNMWFFAYDMRRELPVRFQLEPGRHTLTVSESHFQEFGIDRVIITNDLGRRPEGRLRPWQYDVAEQ